MITKMKKLQCLVYGREYDEFLKQLRTLGVVHVEADNINEEAAQELSQRMIAVERLERIAAQLRQTKTDVADTDTAVGNAQNGYTAADRVEAINSRLVEIGDSLHQTSADIEALSPWGDFDPKSLDMLADVDRCVRFYTATADTPLEGNTIVINSNKKNVWFVSIDHKDEIPTHNGATEVQLPTRSLSEARKTLIALTEEQHKLQDELQAIAAQHIADIDTAVRNERASVNYRQVQLGVDKEVDGTLMVLTGWLPADNEQVVADMLSNSKAWFEISMPTRNDRIPTLMRNGRITRLYEVLTNMYGTPDYDEFDSTPMIAIFFSLFFGFCVGDAGYGLVLLLFGFPICKFLKDGLQLCINPVLVTVLGATSTLVGLLLGTAFGVDLYALDAAWINWMHPYMVKGEIAGYDVQMVLALAIGVVHICIAMFVKALGSTIRYGFRVALVDWSWWVLIVGAVAIGMLMILTNIPQETLQVSLMIIGIVCGIGIYLLNDPNRNVGLNIGAGLWATYNMATGLMGDVLSYIRLYALGLAGGMLGGVFNQLALQVGEGNEYIGWLFTLLILIFGHTLNLAMSCLSAFVHPLRLTFVEYFKNSGYNGKGIAYKPFTK